MCRAFLVVHCRYFVPGGEAAVLTSQESSLSDLAANVLKVDGRAVVTPTNSTADGLHIEMLARLQSPFAVFLSRDEVLDASPSERDHFPEDFLNGVTTCSVPPHNLHLKIGSVVICLRNIARD